MKCVGDDLSAVDLRSLASAQGWQNQYRMITQWGKLISTKPDIRTDAHLIKGCELPVWLKHLVEHQQHYFLFDSDSRVINGLVSLLLAKVNGKTSADLQSENLQALFVHLGLEKHLTPSRNNGLKTIIATMENTIRHR